MPDWFIFFSGFEGLAGYFVVLGTLVACGLGVPVPEDIILISGGYIADGAGHGVWPMVATGLVGIVIGDSITFFAGRRFGLSLAQTSFFGRFFTPDRLVRADALFRRHGEKLLIAARFMPGVRAVTFFSAGAMKVPYWKFLLFDGLAALVSAPLWVILGYRYGRTVVEWAAQFSWVLLAALAIGLCGWLAFRYVAARTVTRQLPVALPVSATVPAPARSGTPAEARADS